MRQGQAVNHPLARAKFGWFRRGSGDAGRHKHGDVDGTYTERDVEIHAPPTGETQILELLTLTASGDEDLGDVVIVIGEPTLHLPDMRLGEALGGLVDHHHTDEAQHPLFPYLEHLYLDHGKPHRSFSRSPLVETKHTHSPGGERTCIYALPQRTTAAVMRICLFFMNKKQAYLTD